MRNTIFLVFCALILLISCGKEMQVPGGQSSSGGGAGRPAGPGMGMRGASGAPSEYPVLTVSTASVVVHQDFPATIEGQRVVEIRPMVNGYLQDIHVNEGDRVRKGQLLFKISNPVLEEAVVSAKARISSVTAEVNTAAMEVEKVKPLVEKEIVSSYRLKSAELALQAKQAALEDAKATLKNAETNLGYTYIKSPQDGVIGIIPFKGGALVSSNSLEPLTTLSDISEVFAYFSWNEKQLLDLLTGTSGKTMDEKIKALPPATLILANSSEYPVKGRIEMASGLISAETGSATFKAIFKNPDGILRSGASALVRLPKSYDSIIVVPQSATFEMQDKRFLYKLGPENKVTSVNISYFPADDGKSFIVTSGLSSGDVIVTQGIVSLRDGTVIIPKDAASIQGDVNKSNH